MIYYNKERKAFIHTQGTQTQWAQIVDTWTGVHRKKENSREEELIRWSKQLDREHFKI